MHWSSSSGLYVLQVQCKEGWIYFLSPLLWSVICLTITVCNQYSQLDLRDFLTLVIRNGASFGFLSAIRHTYLSEMLLLCAQRICKSLWNIVLLLSSNLSRPLAVYTRKCRLNLFTVTTLCSLASATGLCFSVLWRYFECCSAWKTLLSVLLLDFPHYSASELIFFFSFFLFQRHGLKPFRAIWDGHSCCRLGLSFEWEALNLHVNRKTSFFSLQH